MTESSKGTLRGILREMEPDLCRAERPGEMNQDTPVSRRFPGTVKLSGVG
jgi:hypothetical protein